MSKSLISVVIPIYKPTPDDSEVIALEQCLRVLSSYPIIFVKPSNLNVAWYEQFCNNRKAVTFLDFDSDYFAGIAGYNRLLLSSQFYKRFISYKYILIYQLDAFVFQDNLREWCAQNFDYIGAPWYNLNADVYSHQKQVVDSNQALIKWIRIVFNRNKGKKIFVGNGGLSLRKVNKFYFITKWMPYLFPRLTKVYLNEDVVWSFFVSAFFPFFKIPEHSIARKFSIETIPDQFFKTANFELPFGTHAWALYAYEEWKPYILDQGYKV